MSFDMKPLGELCRLTMGRTPPRGNSKYWDPTRKTKNIWISIADMTKSSDGSLIDSKEYLSDEGSRTFPKVKLGTLLLSFKLSIGKLAIAGSDLQTNEAIVAMNDLNEDLILRDYLYYYLFGFDWSEALEGRFKVKGNTLNKKILEALPVKFPSLEKQRDIVKKLDSTFAEIELLEQNLGQNLLLVQQLFESLLSSAFTPTEVEIEHSHSQLNDSNSWHEVSLKELCEVDWGNTKLTKSSYVINGAFLAVSASGADGRIDHYEHEANVPVLSAIGAQCGKMFYPNEKFTAIKNTITLTPKNDMADGKFMYYLFSHVEIPQRGAGQPFISKGDIEAFQVYAPISLEVQREIVEKLDKSLIEIDLMRSQYKKEIDKAGALRQSILNDALTLEEVVA